MARAALRELWHHLRHPGSGSQRRETRPVETQPVNPHPISPLSAESLSIAREDTSTNRRYYAAYAAPFDDPKGLGPKQVRVYLGGDSPLDAKTQSVAIAKAEGLEPIGTGTMFFTRKQISVYREFNEYGPSRSYTIPDDAPHPTLEVEPASQDSPESERNHMKHVAFALTANPRQLGQLLIEDGRPQVARNLIQRAIQGSFSDAAKDVSPRLTVDQFPVWGLSMAHEVDAKIAELRRVFNNDYLKTGAVKGILLANIATWNELIDSGDVRIEDLQTIFRKQGFEVPLTENQNITIQPSSHIPRAIK